MSSPRFLLLLSLLLVVLSVPQPFTSTVSAATDPCAAPVNAIACENSKPGSPQSEWDLPNGDGSSTIEGFAADISVNVGERVAFKVKTNASAYRIDIYRLGYYGGLGARKVATVRPTVPLPQTQPACAFDSATRLVDCGNWFESASWQVPADAVSGVYIGKLVRESGSPGVNHIIFVVRNDFGQSDLLFQTSDTTWQAYNRYGGYSVYYPDTSSRAYKVSYNRPFLTRECCDETFFFSAEYPMLRWLEANGYNVSYFTGVDTARRGGLLRQHRVFMTVGHNEYVSGEERANIEAAGIHLAFFSGNDIYWKTRWEPGFDGNPYGTLVTYKETYASAKIDPSPLWTGTWRDPRFSPPSDGGRPENALTGTLYTVNCCQSEADQNFSIQVPEPYGKFRLWRDTSVAALAPGTTAVFTPGSLGYEWNEDVDNGARPAGLARLSSATYNVGQRLIDYGNTYAPGPATHHLTLYRQGNGSLVFGAGTIRWAWGLDATHDYPNPPTDVRMQQATVNLFADMGVQPASLQPGLVPATMSGDASAPQSTIDQPTGTFPVLQSATISGSATDFGGGLVAGIEVSVDGGATWHPVSGWAPGQNRWTHTWTPTRAGSITIKTRAVDDSANLEVPGAGTTITVQSRPCPCSIWSASTVPAVASSGDTSPNELGLKFRTDTDGYITAVRFYKGPANTGQHVGHLWTSGGTLLGTVTFTNETASGWQQANFSSPIPVTAGQTYVVSYFAPNGGYAQNSGYFTSTGVDASPLFALAANVDGPNGVYSYGASGFPTLAAYLSSNYWVDVVFDAAAAPPPQPMPPAAPTGVTATAVSSTQIDVAWQASSGATGYRVDRSVDGGTTWTAAGTTAATTFSNTGLTPSTTYSYRIIATNADGSSPPSATATATTPAAAGSPQCPCSIWSASTVPAVASSGDTSANELGLKFRTDTDGFINGVRFYKGPANTGQHVGHLWTSTGTLLGTVTFTNETASGWQQANFSSPIPVTAGQTYVVSYFAPNGGYAQNADYFTSAGVNNSPLFALAANVDGPNGVYRYGSSGFPSLAGYASSNYWVDVVFTSAAAPPPPPPQPTAPATPTGVSATAVSSTQIDVAWQASSGATGYRVDRSLDGGTTWTTAGTTTSATTFSNTGLTPATSYWYRVVATNADGASSPSATVTAKTPADTTAPSTPANVTATAGSQRITVSWSASTDTGGSGLAGYEIWRSSSGGAGTFSRIATTTATSYTNSGLKKRATFWYYVVAYDGAGNKSAPSAVVNARAN